MATRTGRQGFVDPCLSKYAETGHNAPFLSILINNIQVFGSDTDETPPHFISKTLVMTGGIAFLRDSKKWAAFRSVAHANYAGIPKKIRLVGDLDRLSAPMDVDGARVCIIPANAFFFPPALDVVRRVETLDMIAGAVGQNIDALRQCTAITYDDESLKGRIEEAEKKRLNGSRTVSIQKSPGASMEIKNFTPDTKSYIMDFMEVWKQTLEELDAVTGRATIGEKNERRITEEVSVIEDAASTAIDVVIDTFNEYAEFYDIKAIAARGSSLKRITPKQEKQPPQPQPEPQNDDKGGQTE